MSQTILGDCTFHITYPNNHLVVVGYTPELLDNYLPTYFTTFDGDGVIDM